MVKKDLVLHTVQEIARLLKVSQFSIYRWIREDKLKALKMNSIVRITDEELQRFMHTGDAPVQATGSKDKGSK